MINLHVRSLYIHNENVQIIWNAMRAIPLFDDVFGTSITPLKQQWFQDIINRIYRSYDMSGKHLSIMNQITITEMLGDLSKHQVKYRFARFQNDLETSHPPNVKLCSETPGPGLDTPINNLEEILQNYKDQRSKLIYPINHLDVIEISEDLTKKRVVFDDNIQEINHTLAETTLCETSSSFSLNPTHTGLDTLALLKEDFRLLDIRLRNLEHIQLTSSNIDVLK